MVFVHNSNCFLVHVSHKRRLDEFSGNSHYSRMTVDVGAPHPKVTCKRIRTQGVFSAVPCAPALTSRKRHCPDSCDTGDHGNTSRILNAGISDGNASISDAVTAVYSLDEYQDSFSAPEVKRIVEMVSCWLYIGLLSIPFLSFT
jgi:hypothetical protein